MAKIVKKKILLNSDLAKHKKGSKIDINCEEVSVKVEIEVPEGDEKQFVTQASYIPTDRYWRDRLSDSRIDKCMEFVVEPEPEQDLASQDSAPQDSASQEPTGETDIVEDADAAAGGGSKPKRKKSNKQ